jgi:hypothetical protein
MDRKTLKILNSIPFWNERTQTSMARSLRLAIIYQQFKAGYLEYQDAIDLLNGPLTPGDESTIFLDGKWLDELEEKENA